MAYDLTSTAIHRSYETFESLREVGEALWEAARAALGAADAVNPAPFDVLPSIDSVSHERIVDVVSERYAVLAEYVAMRKAAWDHMEKFGDAFIAFHKRCSGGIAAWNKQNCEPLMRWFIEELFGKHVRVASNGNVVVKDRLRAQKEMDDGFNKLRTYPNQSAFKEKKKAIDDALQNTTLETPLPVLSRSPRLPRGDGRIPFDFQARLPVLSKSPGIPRGDDRVQFTDFEDDQLSMIEGDLATIPYNGEPASKPDFSGSWHSGDDANSAPQEEEPQSPFYDPEYKRDDAVPKLGRRMTSDEIAAGTYDRAVPGPRGRTLYPGDHEIDEEQRVDMSPMKERSASPKSVQFSEAVSPVKGEYVNDNGRTVYFQGGGRPSSWIAPNLCLAAVVVTAAFMG